MNVGELIDMLRMLPEDAPLDASVCLEDGTHVFGARIESVKEGYCDVLNGKRGTLMLYADSAALAQSDALAALSPSVLEWVAENGEPLPGWWGREE